jgi:superfamily I DNA/RNA helicase
MRTIIPGPPGTGKTHSLIHDHLKSELFDFKTKPEKICYISFSKAASIEARDRIEKEYPRLKFKYICTMHSLGTQSLGIDTKSQLLKGKNWNGFKNYSQVCKDLSFETIQHSNGYIEYTNPYMKIIDYDRNRKIDDLTTSAIELDLIDDINISLLEQIYQDLKDYKNNFEMFEFSDMITDFTRKRLCPSLDCVFLDEAQDLNPLQWEMFFYIESQCKRSYIAGDDDQAIYAFQGADPKTFINLEGSINAQINSRRVPRAVHKVALSILDNITERRDKGWLPREAEGYVDFDSQLEDIKFKEGTWMILTRTNNQMMPIVEHLQDLGLRFECKFNDLLPTDLVKAINDWNRLNKGAFISPDEAINIYEYLRCSTGDLKRGFSSGQSILEEESVDMDILKEKHGLLVSGDWTVLTMDDAQRNYIQELIASGEDLSKPARIKVATIHSVKGQEADSVILFTDIEPIVYKSALKDPNPEHRLFFVGVTRAKENLFIMNQGYDYQYNIGEDII